jgi:hypothetical protein
MFERAVVGGLSLVGVYMRALCRRSRAVLCGVDAMKDESEEIGEKESLKDEC